MTARNVTILGSTGSVGCNTIDLLAANRDLYHVRALTGGKNVAKLIEQAKLLQPDFVAIADESCYAALKDGLAGTKIDIAAGDKAVMTAAAMSTDWTMCAIVGMAGLKPLMAAIPATKTLAIANKEPLVSAGPVVKDAARKHNVTILPVDSEHSAIFQVFEKPNRDQIKKIILTASGGPFRTWVAAAIAAATPAQAVNHPTWSMGAKISVDSATLMNKSLEVIEAHYLFDMPATQIDVVVHPQSVIHSMVEYIDGSVLAQLGAPDMRTPIAYALAYPHRMPTTGKTLDWSTLSTLNFEPPDFEKFPSLRMAYDCLNAGPAHCIAFNAANEVAVADFLSGKIAFGDIMRRVTTALNNVQTQSLTTLDAIIAFDQSVRATA